MDLIQIDIRQAYATAYLPFLPVLWIFSEIYDWKIRHHWHISREENYILLCNHYKKTKESSDSFSASESIDTVEYWKSRRS